MVFSILVLAISLSLDALGVGIVYGLRQIKIPLSSKLIICFFSILYSGLALILGRSLAAVIPFRFSKLFGIIVLLLMGFWIITQALFKEKSCLPATENSKNATLFKIGIRPLGITIHIFKDPAIYDVDESGIIDIRESLLLGLALSVDAIGVGIGSGLMGLDSMVIPLAVGFCQLIFLYCGGYIGKKFAISLQINEKFLAVLPGTLLILIALIRIW